MQLTITDLMRHGHQYDAIYLSPHLDDAALSCGGAIAAQVMAGRRVLVSTLCTAVPTRAQLGPLAEEFHGDWNLPHEHAVTARLAEDVRAMELLGADYVWAGLLDSIYRLPFAYDTRERLFGTPRPDDPLYPALRSLLPVLRRSCPTATIYAPLGVGYHVDHQITYDVATDLLSSSLAFYEDVYYVLLPGELERRMRDLGRALVSHTIDITASLATKIAAIDAYASQVPELFGGSQAMAESISGYAALVGGEAGAAERIWASGA